MDYVGQIFRPPSEAESLLLQIAVGCSHNKCTYCAMYHQPEQRFRPKDWTTISSDLDEAAGLAKQGITVRRVFLCDGDALILPTEFLVRVLTRLRERIPSVRRIGIYGDARSILRKSPQDLLRLKELGLGIVYHGAESGDDAVLTAVCKGSSAAEAGQAADRLRAAGIRHSVMVMLGLGGREGSQAHAEQTADLLTRMDPPFVGALTTTLVPGTPLADAAAAGCFELPDPWQMLVELRTLVARSRFTRCRFHSNHASNYLPLSLNLPADRDRALATLDKVIAKRNPGELKPEEWRGL